jgi:hypothetical protein
MSSQKIRKLKFQFLDFESATPKGKFIRLANDMLLSPAWKSLTPYAQTIYLRMKAKFTGNNTDDISMTYEEIGDVMDARTFRKYRDELIAKGFIRYIEHNKYTIRCNIYGFSAEWKTWKPPVKKCI